MKILSLNDFSYDFPSHLIAQNPLQDRDHSKLLMRSSEGAFQHTNVDKLADFLSPETLLVVNDTKVFASRIFGKTEQGASIEIFLLSKPEIQDGKFLAPCFLRPGKKVEEGALLKLGEKSYAKLVKKPAKGDMNPFVLDFSSVQENFSEWLKEHALVPLPPYIKREDRTPWNQSSDSERYQTVYANHEGSVAAPTAGLHFTKPLLEKLAKRGIQLCPVTLHVSAGTFLPVKTETISEHKMHTERYCIPSSTWQAIERAKSEGKKILAIGTTSFRCIESFVRQNKGPEDLDQWLETDLFVHPKTRNDRYHSEIFDGILTNFHQPHSTLFMLICALIGFDEAQSLYKEAVGKEYRLFSYGDTSLIWF